MDDVRDRIALRGLRVRGFHGVLAAEREQGQDFLVDVVLSVDVREAAASDDLEDTVDYGALCAAVEAEVVDRRHALLEALAERVAAAVLAADGRVERVTVAVRKLRPPVAQQPATSGVRITRPA